jgi:hypothetical protein
VHQGQDENQDPSHEMSGSGDRCVRVADGKVDEHVGLRLGEGDLIRDRGLIV